MVDVPLMPVAARALPDEAAPRAGRRRRPAALGRTGPGARRRDRAPAPLPTVRLTDLPPGRAEPASSSTPTPSTRARCQSSPAPADGLRLLRRSRPTTPRRRCRRLWKLVASAFPALRPRPGPRHPGAHPHAPRRRRARSRSTAAAAPLNPPGEPGSSTGRTLRASATRSCRSRTTTSRRCFNGDLGFVSGARPRTEGGSRSTSTAGWSLRLRRARRPGARLRDQHPQEPGQRVPGGGDPAADPALPHALAQPALHRRHPRQAAVRAGRPAKGRGDGGAQRQRTATVVKARRVARRCRGAD